MVLCEFFGVQARDGAGQQAVDAFNEFERASAQAAVAQGMQPSLGVHVYPHVQGCSDQAYLFVYWNSREHHDKLIDDPNFRPAHAVLINNFLPNVKSPPKPLWVKVERAFTLQAPHLVFIHARTLSGSQERMEEIIAELPTDVKGALKTTQLSHHVIEGTQDEIAIFLRSDSKEQRIDEAASALLKYLSTVCFIVSRVQLS